MRWKPSRISASACFGAFRSRLRSVFRPFHAEYDVRTAFSEQEGGGLAYTAACASDYDEGHRPIRTRRHRDAIHRGAP
jgi:hypothetical protein